MAITYVVPISNLLDVKSNDKGCSLSELSREMYDYDFDKLRADVEKNGVKEPLRVVGKSLVNGHHRFIVARELGLQELPVTYSGYLDDMPSVIIDT